MMNDLEGGGRGEQSVPKDRVGIKLSTGDRNVIPVDPSTHLLSNTTDLKPLGRCGHVTVCFGTFCKEQSAQRSIEVLYAAERI
jgi:hypothetical protein